MIKEQDEKPSRGFLFNRLEKIISPIKLRRSEERHIAIDDETEIGFQNFLYDQNVALRQACAKPRRNVSIFAEAEVQILQQYVEEQYQALAELIPIIFKSSGKKRAQYLKEWRVEPDAIEELELRIVAVKETQRLGSTDVTEKLSIY